VKKSFSAILIGHVIDTDIRDTLDRINSLGMVSSIDVVMPAPDKKSSVLLEIEADDKCYAGVIKMLEERYANIRSKFQVMEQNMLHKNKAFFTDVKGINLELVEIKKKLMR
jgi:ACT domain-containing protein